MKKKLFFPIVLITAVIMSACGATLNSSDTLPYENAAQATYTALPTYTPYPTQPAPTNAPAQSAQNDSAPAQSANSGGGCPAARDLGPWAPSGTTGEDYEVTASDDPNANLGSNGVVNGPWWPKGNTPWGNKEVTTFIPRGLSVTFIDAGGRGWDYEANCSLAEIKVQMEQHMTTRAGDTAYYAFVDIDELIKLGLVEVRFDRRTAGSDITPAAKYLTPSSSSSGGASNGNSSCGDGVRADRTPVKGEPFKFNNSKCWVIVNVWSNETDPNYGDHKLLLAPDENPALLVGGAYWTFSSEATARGNFASNGLDPVTLTELQALGFVK